MCGIIDKPHSSTLKLKNRCLWGLLNCQNQGFFWKLLMVPRDNKLYLELKMYISDDEHFRKSYYLKNETADSV